MQHASDTVLARMRRPERRLRLHQTVQGIRAAIPGVAIRSTVIVGFPGETDDDFRQLLEFLEEVELERVGFFTYSPQEGTRAFSLPDDVPEEVKRERLERASEVQRLVTASRYERRLGKTDRAIVDRGAVNSVPAQARIQAQADDIDGVTWVVTDAAPGSFIDVRLDSVVDDYDFSATFAGRIDRPQRTATARKSRVLRVASSIGSYGRGG
jgi:ribosomal protein S12 methylthiotransferase